MQNKFSFESPATISLIGLMVALFALTFFLGNVFSGENFASILVFAGGDNISLVLNGQVWRIVTAAFLHANFLHLGMNMYSLFMIGKLIEDFYGSKKLVWVFVFSAIGGSILSFVITIAMTILGLSAIENSLTIVSVGASGGLFGMMGVLIGNKLKNDPFEPKIPIDEMSLVAITLINIVFGFVIPGINNWAHIGGLFTGILIGMVIKTRSNFNKEGSFDTINWILFLSSILIVLLSFIIHILYILFIGL